MNNEEIEKLKNKITEFKGQDVFIKLENAIQYYATISTAEVIISDQKLIISDSKKQDFIIELYYIDNVTVDGNTIYLNMSNDIKITLDY